MIEAQDKNQKNMKVKGPSNHVNIDIALTMIQDSDENISKVFSFLTKKLNQLRTSMMKYLEDLELSVKKYFGDTLEQLKSKNVPINPE